MPKEKKIYSEVIFKGKILTLKKDIIKTDNNIEATREIIEHRGAVAIIPYHNNGFYLVKQYRYAIKSELWEIPAGLKEIDEKPKDTAIRELIEEINFRPDKLSLLGEFYSTPGFSNEIISLFIAENLKEDRSRKQDIDENLLIKKFSINEIIEKIKSNEIKDLKTILAFYLAFEYLNISID